MLRFALLAAILIALGIADRQDDGALPELSPQTRIQGASRFVIPVGVQPYAERFFVINLDMDFWNRGGGFSSFLLPSGQELVLASSRATLSPELRRRHIFGFQVADLAEARKAYEARDIPFMDDVQEKRVGKRSYFREPNGFLMQIFEPPREVLPRPMRKKKQIRITGIRSVLLSASDEMDISEMREFYSDRLGFRADGMVSRSGVMRSGGLLGSYGSDGGRRFVVSGGGSFPDVCLELWASESVWFSGVILGFTIENDIEEARAILEHRGVEILSGLSGGGWFYIRGPDGLIFRIEEA